jgi:hypothetical protein
MSGQGVQDDGSRMTHLSDDPIFVHPEGTPGLLTT